ncbi:MAG: cysteine--tRNA ligase [Calditrichaeota bacterium]|nr:cysteine--tRNA ligase [Calditrichota bacterium]
MTIQFYDARRRRKAPFEPLHPGEARLYTCGPTVYKDAHIGNLRTYIFEDLLRRTLKFFGLKVVQVMNLTDIDDKTIRQSHASGVALKTLTAPIIERFFRDLKLLNIERAEIYPAATDHIPEIIALIERLLAKGYAYQAENNVYFSVERFPEYGQLSGMNLQALARGVRIDADEYEDKENFRDFALWKGWTQEDGDVAWDSPFGRGRPGWHIECSAMSMKYLGEEFDIHTGGVDNIFPHHENEIAQSVAATGKSFVRYWLHSAHLLVNGEKMSKSLGNQWTLSDLLERGLSPRAIRYLLLSGHYRQQLNFTFEAVQAAGAALQRLDTLHQAASTAEGDGPARDSVRRIIETARNKFSAALADDLNISEALAALFDLVAEAHRIRREMPLNRAEGFALQNFWHYVDRVIGALITDEVEIPTEIEQLVHNRMRLRTDRKYAEADAIRQELAGKGYQIDDTNQGSVIIWAKGRKLVNIPH